MNHIKMVKLLLFKGSDTFFKDHGQRTALYYAVREGYVQIAKYLIYYEAKTWSTEYYNFNKMMEDNAKMRKIFKIARRVNHFA